MAYERILHREDMMGCALCQDAPCSLACPKLDCAKALRSIWFDNEGGAAAALPVENPCLGCDAPCEKACVKTPAIPISRLITRLHTEVKPDADEVSVTDESRLKCDICGVPLENPFLLSSSVVASTYDMCARAFEAGWAGASFKTICTMDIHEASPRYSAIKGSDGSIIGFKNVEQLSDHSLVENMEIFRRLKKNYPTKFILASIMGKDEEEWEMLARLCQENGADAIELNFSCPNMAESGMGSDIGQHPEQVERFTAAARRGCTIPLLVKPTPNVTFMSDAAHAGKRSGADGFSIINTIKSITNVNPHTYVSAPSVHGMSAVGGYSGNAVKPIALRFVAEVGQDPETAGMHISGQGGVETWRDALEFILMGSSSIQITTAVMQYGYRIIEDLKDGLNRYLTEKGFGSVTEAIGLALDSVSPTTNVLERDTVIFPKFDRSKCIGCGRCVISCSDGGHQALRLNAERKPVLDGKRCVGCHLCLLVCPERAISPARKRIDRSK